jgi:hypothetical protein
MHHSTGSVRVLALSLGFALAACGGSSGKGDAGGGVDAGPDGAGGAGGGAAGFDGGGFVDGIIQTTGSGGAAGNDAAIDAPDAAKADAPDASDAADALSGAPDAGDAEAVVDATPTAGLCAALPIDALAATVMNVNTGKAIDAAGFTGGSIGSGTYWLTSVTHFGGTYAGPTQELWVVDATAKTLEDAYVATRGPAYAGFSISNGSPSILAVAPSCGGAAASRFNYIAAGSGPGATLSVNPEGSSDVKIFTRQ